MTTPPLAVYTLPDSPPWMERNSETAVCAETDPDLWFPETGQWTTSRIAKRLCASCPVLAECKSWALAHPDEAAWGIWAGMTERERADYHLRNERGSADSTGAAA